MNYYAINTDPYLQHFGVKGMKWGVRRYENYDGSYTQRGLKRYKESAKQYDEKRTAYKSVKAGYKAGSKSKLEVNRAKNEMKTAKRQANKDYKQLKWDKKADQGKDLYKRGTRITSNNEQLSAIATVGGLAAYGARYINRGKTIETKFGTYDYGDFSAAAIGTGTAVVGGIMKVHNERQNNKLRAYYAH